MAHTPQHFAILIGIDAYPTNGPHPPIKGAVNDVEKIKTLLEKRGFPLIPKITVLTATSDHNGGFNERYESLPTEPNITKAIKGVKENAREKDCVYIHFSGHGSHMSTAPGKREHETNYSNEVLALCVLDHEDLNRVRPLRGIMFAKSLNGLVSKGVVVTVVLDCCFSSRVYREKGEEKQGNRNWPWPYIGQPEEELSLRQGYTTSREMPDSASLVSDFRGLSMSQNWLLNPDGYTIIAACGPLEEALEMSVGGKTFGKLTYFLSEIFDNHGFGLRQRDVYSHILNRFLAEEQRQTPLLYGNKDQFFLGVSTRLKDLSPDHFPTVQVTVPTDGSAADLILQAGQAHGVRRKDKVILYPSWSRYRNSNMHQENLKTATVQQVDALRSTLRVNLGNDESQDASQLKYCIAELASRSCLREYSVCVDSSIPDTQNLHISLEKRSVNSHGNPSQAYAFRVKLEEYGNESDIEKYYALCDSNGERLVNTPLVRADLYDAEDVATLLTHVVKYTYVKNLKCGQNGESMSFRNSFDLYLKDRHGTEYQPNQRIELQESLLGDEAQTSFRFEFINKSPFTLYVYIFTLDCLWEVRNAPTSTFQIVPSETEALEAKKKRNEIFEPKFTKMLSTTVATQMRGKFRYSDELVKVFVTSRPTIFDLFEQPSIGTLFRSMKRKPWPEATGQHVMPEEVWDVFDFPVRTVFI